MNLMSFGSLIGQQFAQSPFGAAQLNWFIIKNRNKGNSSHWKSSYLVNKWPVIHLKIINWKSIRFLDYWNEMICKWKWFDVSFWKFRIQVEFFKMKDSATFIMYLLRPWPSKFRRTSHIFLLDWVSNSIGPMTSIHFQNQIIWFYLDNGCGKKSFMACLPNVWIKENCTVVFFLQKNNHFARIIWERSRE